VISRQWRGLAKASRAGDYIEHLRKDTFPQLRKFAGDDATTAVVPPEVQAMMIEYDKTVRHYEVME
jgi:hypothetical protein